MLLDGQAMCSAGGVYGHVYSNPIPNILLSIAHALAVPFEKQVAAITVQNALRQYY
jgi:hypothetical protein